MNKFNVFNTENINDNLINNKYSELLESKNNYMIIICNKKNYVLTKERSFFEVKNINNFVKKANNDIYYKTEVVVDSNNYHKKDLYLFKNYLNKYKGQMTKMNGNKYLFGSVAVKTINNAFITTIRGKEDLNEYTIVNGVDHINNIVKVTKKKATLNAPLLDNIFKNNKVKVIVHLNQQYDDSLPYYKYYFPGTKKDSNRNNKTSFNIKYHGLFLLFDENGNLL